MQKRVMDVIQYIYIHACNKTHSFYILHIIIHNIMCLMSQRHMQIPASCTTCQGDYPGRWYLPLAMEVKEDSFPPYVYTRPRQKRKPAGMVCLYCVYHSVYIVYVLRGCGTQYSPITIYNHIILHTLPRV